VNVTQDNTMLAHRGERILAFMVASAIGLSVLSFLAVIIATAAGVTDFDGGVWPVLIVLPAVGLPLGLVLMIALIVVSGIRRSRDARDASQ
jgi:L-cystine uptake protein TcyP (sodium:dicarboxylate symporter family)